MEVFCLKESTEAVFLFAFSPLKCRVVGMEKCLPSVLFPRLFSSSAVTSAEDFILFWGTNDLRPPRGVPWTAPFSPTERSDTE